MGLWRRKEISPYMVHPVGEGVNTNIKRFFRSSLMPNVLGSPHNSAVVSHALVDAARQAAENVKRFLVGEKVTGMARREDYL
jgi:hypothetical protein